MSTQSTVKHLTREEIEQRYTQLEPSPKEQGTVEMIVRRPDTLQREVVEQAEINTEKGMIGDNWYTRGSRHTDDGSAHPDMQMAIMNSRIIDVIAQERDNWAPAGDQLFVDFDLSEANLPIGQRFAIGDVVLEVSPFPHKGCKKFKERYGLGASRFINDLAYEHLRLRGINVRVIQGGVIKTGDTIRKL